MPDSNESPQVEDDVEETEIQLPPRLYPQRERKAPEYFESNNSTCVNVDYCYRALDVLQTYSEAMKSAKAPEWEQAMKDELEALEENNTFELTSLPEGKNLVGENGSMPLKKQLMAWKHLKPDMLLRVIVKYMDLTMKRHSHPQLT